MSKCMTKDHKERSKCMTNLSLLEPLLIAITRLALSHLKFTWCLDRRGPQMMQANIIGTSSLAIISILYHSSGIAIVTTEIPAQPHNPMFLTHQFGHKSLDVMRDGCRRMLKPFHDCRNVCHQNKSYLNALFSLVI